MMRSQMLRAIGSSGVLRARGTRRSDSPTERGTRYRCIRAHGASSMHWNRKVNRWTLSVVVAAMLMGPLVAQDAWDDADVDYIQTLSTAQLRAFIPVRWPIAGWGRSPVLGFARWHPQTPNVVTIRGETFDPSERFPPNKAFRDGPRRHCVHVRVLRRRERAAHLPRVRS